MLHVLLLTNTADIKIKVSEPWEKAFDVSVKYTKTYFTLA